MYKINYSRIGRLVQYSTRHYTAVSKRSKQPKSNHLASVELPKSSVVTKPTASSSWLSRSVTKVHETSDVEISHRLLRGLSDNYIVELSLLTNDTFVKPASFHCAIDVSASMAASCIEGGSDSSNAEDTFSRLDLARHSMKTIVACLRPCDKLSISTFSTGARLVLQPTLMDANGKSRAESIITSFREDSATNLWAGTASAMNSVESDVANCNNFVAVLTDGQSNTDPPSGIYNQLQRYVPKSRFSLGMFGYGYSLDSRLLYDMSKLYGGCFNHIPDGVMCNTVFVNYLANSLSTIVNSAFMSIADTTNCRTSFNPQNIGSIQSGQARKIYFQVNIPDTNNFKIDIDFDFDARQQSYTISDQNSEPTIPTMNPHMVVKCMLDILSDGSINREDRASKMDFLHGELSQVVSTNVQTQEHLRNLADNIKSDDYHNGQVYKALSNVDFYRKWGIHYLQYFTRAHELQQCANFKDASLQMYGGRLFRELQQEIEDILINIPPPTPSRATASHTYTGNFQQSFYQSSNPCVAGDCEASVILGYKHSTKLVRDLIAGDIVCDSYGNTGQIICVLRTVVPNGVLPMLWTNTGLKVTPWHPIRFVGEKDWCFPNDVGGVKDQTCDYVYNFVLDSNHIVQINGVDVITMGHNYTEDVISHGFFGSEKVIDTLKRHKGWARGFIDGQNYKPMYDGRGKISDFTIEEIY